MIEENFGGTIGDTSDGLLSIFILPFMGFIFFVAIFAGIYSLFQTDIDDISVAKFNKKSIVCKGFFKDYTIPHNSYYITNNEVKMSVDIFPDKTFQAKDCSIL